MKMNIGVNSSESGAYNSECGAPVSL